jgi:MOSC domain-containing protein YiiM
MDGSDGRRGRLEGLWIKRAKLGPMDPVTAATLVEGRGLAGNANQGGTRQVTVIEKEVFDRLRRWLDPTVDPSMRRANLLVSGIRLEESRGAILHVGDCRILLVGETRPCERMDQALPGLRKALEPRWGGGAYGRVTLGGDVRVGDEVRLEVVAEDATEAPGAQRAARIP